MQSLLLRHRFANRMQQKLAKNIDVALVFNSHSCQVENLPPLKHLSGGAHFKLLHMKPILDKIGVLEYF